MNKSPPIASKKENPSLRQQTWAAHSENQKNVLNPINLISK